ncbi:MAG: lanthionine synthetase LanC family protein [Longimicrobiales bacterium]
MTPSRRDVLRTALGAAGLLTLPRELWGHAYVPPDYLDCAVRAERWIRTARVPTERGVLWPADPNDAKSVQRGLYNGFPGIVVFLLELFHATGERKYLEEAMAGARELVAGLPGSADAVGDAGLYTGLAGIGFVLEEAQRASRDASMRGSARRVLELIKQSARPMGAGVEWSESTDIISGSAGIGLYLLRAARVQKDRSAVELAAKAGHRLLQLAQPEQGGLKWAISPRVTNRYPNFSHGAAGVGYFLATLYEVTREPAFLDGALAATRYLDAVARKEGNGWMVFHHEPGGADLFYLSWCHGPPGTARLFYRLSQVTRDPRWTETMHHCAQATMATGIPEQRTPGFWNNMSQCCGNCGVGEFFLSMHQLTPRAPYLSMAQRCAADTLQRAVSVGEGLHWIQAEHRVRPELLVAQTGFMQGAAGAGTFFLHMHGFEQRRKAAIVFPDNPFA